MNMWLAYEAKSTPSFVGNHKRIGHDFNEVMAMQVASHELYY